MKARKLKKNEWVVTIKAYVDWDMDGKETARRIIEMPAEASLYQLAETILDSIDFDMDHAFGFYEDMKEPLRSEVGFELFADLGEPSRFPGVKKTIILEAFPMVSVGMLFLFDYGDEWDFPLLCCEMRLPRESDKELKFPRVVESVGEAPEQYPDYDEDAYEDDLEDEEGEETQAEIIQLHKHERLTSQAQQDIPEEVSLVLSKKDRALLLELTFMEDEILDLVSGAPENNNRVRLVLPYDLFDDMMGYLAHYSNDHEDRNVRKKLDALYDKIEAQLDLGEKE